MNFKKIKKQKFIVINPKFQFKRPNLIKNNKKRLVLFIFKHIQKSYFKKKKNYHSIKNNNSTKNNIPK